VHPTGAIALVLLHALWDYFDARIGGGQPAANGSAADSDGDVTEEEIAAAAVR
jgi:hypothetical protein